MTAPLPEEKVAALAEALCDRYSRDYGAHGVERHCDGHLKDAQALAPLIAGWLAEAEISGQMKHITAEVARGDVPLSESEELIADLRARVSHLEAERDELLTGKEGAK